MFKRSEPIKWQCRNCGYVHTGTEAPKTLSRVSAPAGLFRADEEQLLVFLFFIQAPLYGALFALGVIIYIV